MVDLYWRYVTQGVVDITSVISPQATNLEGLWEQDHSEPPGVEVVTPRGSEVPDTSQRMYRNTAYPMRKGQNWSGIDHAARQPDPPRAGRSRSAGRSSHIAPGTDASASKGPACPCCGGTAGLMQAGKTVCTLCQRAPLHLFCGRCWDHCGPGDTW